MTATDGRILMNSIRGGVFPANVLRICEVAEGDLGGAKRNRIFAVRRRTITFQLYHHLLFLVALSTWVD